MNKINETNPINEGNPSKENNVTNVEIENQNVENSFTDNSVQVDLSNDDIVNDKTDLDSEATKVSDNQDINNIAKSEQKDISYVNEDLDDEDEDVDLQSQSSDNDNNEKEEAFDERDLKSKSLEDLVGMYDSFVSGDYNPESKAIVSALKIYINKRLQGDYKNALEKFISEGGEENEFEYAGNPFEEKFKQLVQLYKEKRHIYLEEQENQKTRNLELKLKMLENLKELVESNEPLKKIHDEFNNLVAEWKVIGAVPRTEANTLWQNYHHYVDEFYKKVKINKELRDLDLRKNLEAKIELCEKIEALLIEQSITKSFKLLQLYHDKWKEIGPVPSDQSDDIWQRFKIATDKINERRRQYYSDIAEQQKKNYETKIAICEKTEELLAVELKSFEDYKSKTAEINEMINLWKTVGQAPKKLNDEIWERFRALTNTFYDNKKEYFEQLKDLQTENYNKKVQICVQAEALKNNNDWKRTTKELINLQEEWKKIGPAPKKQADKLWKRFRSACDEFFNNKAKYFANIDETEKENLRLKQELIKKLDEYQFGIDRNENLEVLKNFQREWISIGHVPIKNKNQVQDAFRLAIDKQLDKLKINSVEISTLEFKSRMEQLKNTPGSDKIIGKERFQLQSSLSKIKNDINLWENNIGFLANSKNADLLKEEFSKKIDKAKQEAKILETKIKFLEKQGK